MMCSKQRDIMPVHVGDLFIWERRNSRAQLLLVLKRTRAIEGYDTVWFRAGEPPEYMWYSATYFRRAGLRRVST